MRRLLPIGRARRDAGGSAREELGSPAAKLRLLRAQDLFHDLAEADMERVAAMTTMARCPRGRIVYAPGETGEGLFLVKSGRMTLYRLTPDGKKLVTGQAGPGTLFGDMAFLGQSMFENFAEATEDSLLCVMSRHDLEELIRLYPSIAVRLIDSLSRHVRELEERLEESSLRGMESRVASALLRARNAQESGEIELTHQLLADTIGTHRETVTRVLGGLQEQGLIRLERGKVYLLKPTELKRLAWEE